MERRNILAGTNPAQRLSLRLVAAGRFIASNGLPGRKFAKDLGRHLSTVDRENSRNGGFGNCRWKHTRKKSGELRSAASSGARLAGSIPTASPHLLAPLSLALPKPSSGSCGSVRAPHAGGSNCRLQGIDRAPAWRTCFSGPWPIRRRVHF